MDCYVRVIRPEWRTDLWTRLAPDTTLLNMRAFEVILRSGAKNEVIAEVMHDDPSGDDKIYFYRDKSLKQLVAYFQRVEVAGVILGPDNATTVQRYK